MATVRELQKLATKLGFRGLKSFAEIYKGGAKQTFGHPQNSMWTLTVHIDNNDVVSHIEIHRTYFTQTPQIIALHEFLGKEGKPLNEAIAFVENFKK